MDNIPGILLGSLGFFFLIYLTFLGPDKNSSTPTQYLRAQAKKQRKLKRARKKLQSKPS